MIPLSVSEKLLRLAGGEQLPASAFKHSIVEALIDDGIILERISGRTKKTLYIADADGLHTWLYSRHGINNLADYIRVLKDDSSKRADLIQVSNDSKTQNRRSYKGFLVNSYLPIQTMLNGNLHFIDLPAGAFEFIYDLEHFVPAADVTIVGIENMESFRHIDKLVHLFHGIKPLFVCRYPQQQAKDLITWLTAIPNDYLHFGDYDLAGINIYMNEYKKHLLARASFFIPGNIGELIARYGNPKLYDKQKLAAAAITEQNIAALIDLIHLHKKGLEQEALLIYDNTNLVLPENKQR